jgi:hypothetical protein
LEQLADSCSNRAKFINLYRNLNGDVVGRISLVKSFDPDSLFEEPWLLNQFRRPIKWNQGGYDAVGLFKEGRRMVLRFIQVTRGSTHKMNMRFFACLAV